MHRKLIRAGCCHYWSPFIFFPPSIKRVYFIPLHWISDPALFWWKLKWLFGCREKRGCSTILWKAADLHSGMKIKKTRGHRLQAALFYRTKEPSVSWPLIRKADKSSEFFKQTLFHFRNHFLVRVPLTIYKAQLLSCPLSKFMQTEISRLPG